jgi:hypothetical protein
VLIAKERQPETETETEIDPETEIGAVDISTFSFFGVIISYLAHRTPADRKHGPSFFCAIVSPPGLLGAAATRGRQPVF